MLLFALGMRDVPVDTHVSRVGTRLGLFRPKAPFEELHDTMLEITPPGEELELHLNLLRHGRRTCYARRPDCWECALQRMCPSAAEFMGEGRRSTNVKDPLKDGMGRVRGRERGYFTTTGTSRRKRAVWNTV